MTWLSALMVAASSAATVRLPPTWLAAALASAVMPSTNARVSLLTIFLASTMPTAVALAPFSATAAEVASLPTVASMLASPMAVTLMSPPTASFVSFT